GGAAIIDRHEHLALEPERELHRIASARRTLLVHVAAHVGEAGFVDEEPLVLSKAFGTFLEAGAIPRSQLGELDLGRRLAQDVEDVGREDARRHVPLAVEDAYATILEGAVLAVPAGIDEVAPQVRDVVHHDRQDPSRDEIADERDVEYAN